MKPPVAAACFAMRKDSTASMARRFDGPDRQPMMLLLAGTDFTIRTAAGPPAVTKALRAANATRLDALPLAPARSVQSALSGALKGKQRSIRWQFAGMSFEGCVAPLTADDGSVAGIALAGVSVLCAEERAELHDLRQAVRQAQEATSSAYYVVDLATGRVTITPAFAHILGVAESVRELSLDDFIAYVHEDDRSAFLNGRSAAIAAGDTLNIEFRVVRPDGEIRYVRAVGGFFTDDNGLALRSVGTVVDITEQVQAQSAVSFLSKRDPLTGLLNRHVLISLLAEYEENGPHALLMLDIDRFAAVNELAGHAVGDQLLRTVGDRFGALERYGHSVARLGGDEFAALLDCRNGEHPAEIAANITRHLSAPYAVDDHEYLLRITSGLAVAPQDGSGTTLLHTAEMAMLAAKATSPGTTGRYDAELEQRLSARARLERDLSVALAKKQFDVYYQPVIDAARGTLCATEALLRWCHPDLGLLTPDVFLDIAEESDLLVPIGRWVMERACRDAARMRDVLKKPLRLNVNVSASQVQSAALVGDVESALDASGWTSELLQLEVTEQMLIADMSRAATTLHDLRARGVSIAIDDFGTGYNTLSYLKSYPINCIKIDRAFVRDSESDDYSRAICKTVKTLAESLRLHCIGEGVETPAQAAFLRSLGCDELQGFHFGYPAPLDEFLASSAA